MDTGVPGLEYVNPILIKRGEITTGGMDGGVVFWNYAFAITCIISKIGWGVSLTFSQIA